MASNVEKKSILEHIFDRVLRCPSLGLKLYDNDLRTPRQIYMRRGEGPWNDLKRDGVISDKEHQVISVFLEWCDWYMDQQDHSGDITKLPKTLIEWRYALQLEAAQLEPPSLGGTSTRRHSLGTGFSSQAATASTEPSNPNRDFHGNSGVEESKNDLPNPGTTGEQKATPVPSFMQSGINLNSSYANFTPIRLPPSVQRTSVGDTNDLKDNPQEHSNNSSNEPKHQDAVDPDPDPDPDPSSDGSDSETENEDDSEDKASSSSEDSDSSRGASEGPLTSGASSSSDDSTKKSENTNKSRLKKSKKKKQSATAHKKSTTKVKHKMKTIKVKPDKKPRHRTLVKVSLMDFPDFDGKHHNWIHFKRGAIATMELLGQHELLEVNGEKARKKHLKLRKKDKDYDDKCIQFFSILNKKLARGAATSMVDYYADTRDGPLAWTDLRDHYDFCGDKDTRMVTIMEELTSLQLSHNSFGGFIGYKNKFENRINELISSEPDAKVRNTMMPDIMKKVMFLRGIVDPDYDGVKDTCDSLSYKDTVNKLYKKSLDLNKSDGRGQTRQQYRVTRGGGNNNYRQGNRGGRGFRNNSGGRGRGNRNWRGSKPYGRGGRGSDKRFNNNTNTSNQIQTPTGSNFLPEVWNSMSKENQRWILDHKNTNKRKAEYGKQYGNLDTRKTNNVNTISKTADKPASESGNQNTTTKKDGDDKPKKDTSPRSIFRHNNMLRTVRSSDSADTEDIAEVYRRRYLGENEPMPIRFLKCPKGFYDRPRIWYCHEHSNGQVDFELACYDQQIRAYKIYLLSEEECKKNWDRQLYAYLLGIKFDPLPKIPPSQKMRDLVAWAIEKGHSYWPTLPELNDSMDELPPEDMIWDEDCVKVTKYPFVPPGTLHVPDVIDCYVMQGRNVIVCWRAYDRRLAKWVHYEFLIDKMKDVCPDVLADDIIRDPNWIQAMDVDPFAKHMVTWAGAHTKTDPDHWIQGPPRASRLVRMPITGTDETPPRPPSTPRPLRYQGMLRTSLVKKRDFSKMGGPSMGGSIDPAPNIQIENITEIVGGVTKPTQDKNSATAAMENSTDISTPNIQTMQQQSEATMDQQPIMSNDANSNNSQQTSDTESYTYYSYSTKSLKVRKKIKIDYDDLFSSLASSDLSDFSDEESIDTLGNTDISLLAVPTEIAVKQNNMIVTSSRHLREMMTHDRTMQHYLIPDSGADTSNVGGPAWIVDTITGRCVDVAGYDEHSGTRRESVPIGGAVTAVDLPAPCNETILVRINEATIIEDGNSLLSTFQARESGTVVEDCATKHGGGSFIAADGYVLPLSIMHGLLALPIRRPTEDELKSCTMIELTSPEPWRPDTIRLKMVTPDDYAKMIEEVGDNR